MNEYKVLIRKSVFAKIKEIADYVETVSNKEHAQQYADELEKSLYILSNPIIVNACLAIWLTLATILAPTTSPSPQPSYKSPSIP